MMSRFASLASSIRDRVPSIPKSSKRAAVVGVLAAIGTVAWAGCGSGDETRYYCDSTGCFDCDAYGCSSVAPPTHAACTGATSCAPGSVCTATGCTQTCSEGVPCAKGEVCKSGLCAAPTVDPGPKKECTSKTDCPSGTCVAGVCEACGGTEGPCPCKTVTDCASGQACVSGSCTAPQNSCKFSSECADGKVCADGQCLSSCEATPCAADFTCEKGVCNPSGGSTCNGDQQCGGTTPQCVDGTCVKACSKDPECGAGKFCDQGACVDDTRPTPNCHDDNECGGTAATPKKCVGGFCKYTCTTGQGDPYCKTIDNRIGFCAKDLVCRTSTEANATCTKSSECATGQICIDNQCK